MKNIVPFHSYTSNDLSKSIVLNKILHKNVTSIFFDMLLRKVQFYISTIMSVCPPGLRYTDTSGSTWRSVSCARS